MVKNKLFYVSLCFLGWFSLTVHQVIAQDTDSSVTDVLEFSLEDLMNMKVTVSSKKEEKIADAPGMITAYSSKDIQRLGYYSVADLSNITPGFSAYTAYGEQTLETRGLKAGSWNNNKHLFLIDGIPINHVRANSAPVDHQVPLLFANSIEFMRGPGSALYGTGAFYGVINAKSKELKSFGTEGSFKVSIGTYNFERRAMATVSHKNEYGMTNINAGYYGRDASVSRLGAVDSLRNSDGRLNFDDAITHFTYVNHTITDGKLRGLGVGLIYFNKSSHGGEFWNNQTSPNNDVQWEEAIPYLKFKREWNEHLSISSYLKYNYSKERSSFDATWNKYDTLKNVSPKALYLFDAFGNPISVTTTAGYDYKYSDVEGLLEGNYKLGPGSNIIAGINYDSRRELSSPSSYEFSAASPNSTITNSNIYKYNNKYVGTDWFHTYAAYAQYQGKIDFLNGLLLTVGLREDIGITPTNKYQQLSPRLGLVQKITDKLNVKLLYGQAFRAPGIKELGTNAAIKKEVINNGGDPSGIKDVGAEIIRTLEAGTNYTTEKISLSLSGFYNITLNALDGVKYTYIDKKGVSQDPNVFGNIYGGYTSIGGEAEIKYAPSAQVFVTANHSMVQAKLNDSLQFVKVPTQKTNVTASFTLPGKFKMVSTLVCKEVWGYYVSKKEYGKSIIDGYNTIDLNFLFPITPAIGFEIQGRNLLDSKWYQPAEGGKMMDLRIPRRSALLTLIANF